ncbi:MAG: UvrD-helicase domain-containing protein, partial [Clostridiales bacterium]|nr:UvrD-helicase domain-containing protein [Clostridiales bacterium]
MTEFLPTSEQLDAITARGSSLLISAGAGSGKTRGLTERRMSHLTGEPAGSRDVTDFLIITFTRAAAAELRSRILSAISSELAKNPKNRRLRRQSALVHSAQIDTIHSFCSRIIRENSDRLGIPPDFRIAEESECAALKSAVMSRLLDSRYENIGSFEGFRQLVDTLSPGRDDRRLADTALDIFDKLRSHEDSRLWMREQLELQKPGAVTDVLKTPWGELLAGKARAAAEFWLHRIEALLSEYGDSPEVMRTYGGGFMSVAEQLRGFLSALDTDWDSAMSAAVFDFPGAKPLRGAEYDGIKAVWVSCRDELRKLPDIFIAPSGELIGDMDCVFSATKALFELVGEFGDLYSEEKNRRRIADFSDLEHFALALLGDENGPTELSKVISSRYKEVMVDEFQDISVIQERIINAVSDGGKNLVMVGDVRQSIYRFRLADPAIFLGKYKSFSDDRDAPERRIILADNFRSRQNVLDVVNYVFRGIMSEQFGELDYTDREYLRAGRPDAGCDIPVELRIVAPGESDGDTRQILEADYVARRIEELVKSGFEIPGGGGTRPATYSDIVILMRSRTYAHFYSDALISRGISVVTDEVDSLLDTYEVRVALAFLHIVDNPGNDIELISVLRSPVYGFTPDELAEARLCSREGSFYDALLLYAEKSGRASQFLGHLREFRALAPELGADGLLWHIYNRTHLPALVSVLPDGGRRRSNLTQLAAEARNAGEFGYPDVFSFLRFLERLHKPIGCTSPSSDGVRIMSVHKSKGLEFPIVFLVDLAHRFNMNDSRKRLLFHPRLGLGQKRVDLERRIEYPTLPRLAIGEIIADESKAEDLRVLYVAMTRAREKLIMVYSDLNPERTLEKLHGFGYPVPPHVLGRQSSIGNILLAALLSRPEAESLFGADMPPGLFDMKIVRMTSETRERPAAREALYDTPEAAAPDFIYAYPLAPDLP